jgi:hypothetical protein
MPLFNYNVLTELDLKSFYVAYVIQINGKLFNLHF